MTSGPRFTTPTDSWSTTAVANGSGGRSEIQRGSISHSFLDKNPRGFGLMQRDRAFEHYEDLEARYDLRPSYFVETVGDWGEGRIELVELPSSGETEDNIVAFWVDRESASRNARQAPIPSSRPPVWH